MVELAVDPPLDETLDVAEVGHHVARVEAFSANLDFGDGVVSVRMLAHADVVHQAVPVTELDALGDRVHRRYVNVQLPIPNSQCHPPPSCSRLVSTARYSRPPKRGRTAFIRSMSVPGSRGKPPNSRPSMHCSRVRRWPGGSNRSRG